MYKQRRGGWCLKKFHFETVEITYNCFEWKLNTAAVQMFDTFHCVLVSFLICAFMFLHFWAFPLFYYVKYIISTFIKLIFLILHQMWFPDVWRNYKALKHHVYVERNGCVLNLISCAFLETWKHINDVIWFHWNLTNQISWLKLPVV